ncbi:VWA-like domain-containing protein [Treponema sp.]|uniref:VWA-like domain-containing protein n=1 Tax=Treponema sp. TaxID=166 RepID=UPI00298D65CB|nr:VWA-like domain-containing protein [Treponema sp.]MCR5613595.1 VWA-like domain-containing protein [Treponema sp.]
MEFDLEKKINSIFSSWFYTEPLLYSVSCTHSLVANNKISVPVRSGKMRIEYSPALLSNFSGSELEFILKIEMSRIVLGHPYARKMHNANPSVLYLASDAVIWQLLRKKEDPKNFLLLQGVQYLRQQAGPFATFNDMSFEQWYKYIFDLIAKSKNGQNAGNAGANDGALQSVELWQEDSSALEQIQTCMNDADPSGGWGATGSDLARTINESADFSFDYRRALSQFRQQIVSAERSLTRMRPSRRYGLKAMGSRYERKATLLIAVDVSGSITDESFARFTHAVKNFFFLKMIKKIDLIFFDVNLKNSAPLSFYKKIELKEIAGRGGTNFQIPIDYFEEHRAQYSGMIIFTDGEGSAPRVSSGRGKNILWILDNRVQFDKCAQWINNFTGCRATYLTI